MDFKIKKLDKDKLPVFNIVVDDNDINNGIELISLVDSPAIEVMGMAFADSNSLSFKEVEDKQIIIGPAMIPNMKIYREDDKFGQYYVVFTEETIKKLVEKFNRNGSNKKINIDHTNNMVDGFIIEDWIVEDVVYDKSRKYGFEVPVGTYMIMVKIDDKEFWKTEVKENGKYGFSIEGLLSQQLISLRKQFMKDVDIDDLTEDDFKELWLYIDTEMKKWRKSNIKSSNVNKILYNDESMELIIKFNDGEIYTYNNVDFSLFKEILDGDATCRTSGENEYGKWWEGKHPSFGAAVYEKLVESNISYSIGGSFV